jgi:hypothetical protein
MAAMILWVGAGRAEAQKAQGVGAGAANSNAGASAESKKTHSLNPVKWVKKDKNKSEETAGNSDLKMKLTTKLQAAGLLAGNTTVQETCTNFKALSDCVAALHASSNAKINFACLNWDITGLQPSGDVSACSTTGSGTLSLEEAIHILKPDADAKAEAKTARKQAHDDMKESKF